MEAINQSDFKVGSTKRESLEAELKNHYALLGLVLSSPGPVLGQDSQGVEYVLTRERLERQIAEIKDEVEDLDAPPMQGVKLAPLKERQGDLFVADIIDPALKDDMASMEHPVFALSKNPDLRLRKYERNGNTLEVIPSALGAATIWDKDVVIYCASQLVEAINRGRKDVNRTVRVTAYDLLKATNRGVSGKNYALLKDALDRLAGTRLKTNIETGGERVIKNFGLLDDYEIVEKSPIDSRMVKIDIRLSKWFYNAIKKREVLTLNTDYFRLTSSLERRLYELIRKHCGTQARWVISLAVLREKCGSRGAMKHFRAEIKKIAGSPSKMLGYLMWFNEDSDSLVTAPDTPEGRRALAKFVSAGSDGRRYNVSEEPEKMPVLVAVDKDRPSVDN